MGIDHMWVVNAEQNDATVLLYEFREGVDHTAILFQFETGKYKMK